MILTRVGRSHPQGAFTQAEKPLASAVLQEAPMLIYTASPWTPRNVAPGDQPRRGLHRMISKLPRDRAEPHVSSALAPFTSVNGGPQARPSRTFLWAETNTNTQLRP